MYVISAQAKPAVLVPCLVAIACLSFSLHRVPGHLLTPWSALHTSSTRRAGGMGGQLLHFQGFCALWRPCTFAHSPNRQPAPVCPGCQHNRVEQQGEAASVPLQGTQQLCFTQKTREYNPGLPFIFSLCSAGLGSLVCCLCCLGGDE